MEIVYAVLSSKPGGCIEFYGITILRENENSTEKVCLVFERAVDGTILDYLRANAHSLGWYGFVLLLVNIAWALDGALHRKGIVHRL